MQFQEGGIYHIYNRGNNRQKIFFNDGNYSFFIEKMHRHIYPACDILAWCLMPNHFHFLIHANSASCEITKTYPNQVFKLADSVGLVISSYAKAINKQEARTGSLFQQRTKSKLVKDDHNNYPLTAFNYIHQNPLKAGLVNKLEDWRFSSYNDYAGKKTLQLCKKELATELLNLKLDTFVKDSYAVLNDELVKNIF